MEQQFFKPNNEVIAFAKWIRHNYKCEKGRYRHRGDFYKNSWRKTIEEIYVEYKNNQL